MDNNQQVSNPQMVRKFYFLDYIFILLQSCKIYEERDLVFLYFKILKDKERLGESKYRKLTTDQSELSEKQVKRYIYTFEQVIFEAVNYNLIKDNKKNLILTDLGNECLLFGEKDKRLFYEKLLVLMENHFFAFFDLINLCYSQNKTKNGLLIFPIYSPRKLGFEKDDMKKNRDWYLFSKKLQKKLESDISNFLEQDINLNEANESLLNTLYDDKLIDKDLNGFYNKSNYNSIISRFRKYWLNYFLNKIYNYKHSFETFNIWVERGKQLGIIHSTEFYPNFDGRLVYPTSLIINNTNNRDLVNVFTYKNNLKLYIHKLEWTQNNQDNFVDALVDCYFALKRDRGTHFIRISDLRERVCYKKRIPSFVFNEFLEKIYLRNLKGETKVQISLEADRLPYETNAMYLKREPVSVNGQFKNIIAIDYRK
ncbi:MAG: hypothetical protein LDL23_09665 [Flavobacterium sp.]|uniref:hypothetical protein n=1 Tax=Flavobacterium sp. TaxID=239 RepID=UPI0025C4D435|nr:hypothetical protein [Flavobacterium sp.]MCA1966902.1 hypothetical protein [Flavobacterium sp.]